jgi:O-Antigen ligase
MSVVAMRGPLLAAGRRTALTWAACAITVLLGTGLALSSQLSGVQLPLLGLFMAIPLWLATTSRTMWALGLVLLYMGLIDGFLKLQAGNETLDIGRDLLLYAVVAGMAFRARGPFRLPALGGWVVAWTIVILVQLAHPENGTAAHSIVSLRQHLEFVPLFFVGFVVLRTHRSLQGFFALLLAVATINGAVGAYQSSLTPEQLAGWGPGYASLLSGEAPRTVEGSDGRQRVRPPGLGSDMGFAGILGATALPGGIALLLTLRRRPLVSALVMLGLAGAIVGVLTSQSRSAVVTAVVMVLAMFGLMAIGRQAKQTIIGVFAAAAVCGVALLAIDSYDSDPFFRYQSITPAGAIPTLQEERSGTWAAAPQYMREIPLGAGIGSVGPAAGISDTRPIESRQRQACQWSWSPTCGWSAESQFNFLVVEAGIPGLVVFLAFQAALFAAILAGLRRESDPRTAVLLAGMAAPLFGYAVNWLVGINTTSTPNSAYLWLAAGVVSYWLLSRRQRAFRPIVNGSLRPT